MDQAQNESQALKDLRNLLKEKIIFLDGAMGTMIQKYQLTEID